MDVLGRLRGGKWWLVFALALLTTLVGSNGLAPLFSTSKERPGGGCPTVPANQLPSDAVALMAESSVALRDGQLVVALDKIQDALAAAPHSATLNIHKGLVHRERGELRHAIDAYAAAAELDPVLVEARSNWARVLNDLGEHEEALEQAHHALLIDSNYSPAQNNKGVALLGIGRFVEAIGCFSRALESGLPLEDQARALSNLSLATCRTGAYASAVGFAEQALSIMPNMPEAHVNMALALQGLDENDKAQESLERALELPLSIQQLPRVYSDLGGVCFKMSQYARALHYFERAIEIAPAFLAARSNRAATLAKLMRYGEATEEYHRVLSETDDAFAHYGLAMIACVDGNAHVAMRHARIALTMAPSFTADAAHDEELSCLRDSSEYHEEFLLLTAQRQD